MILVLGSKPDAPLPDFVPTRVYTANGASLRALPYWEMGAPVTSILSAGALASADVTADVIKLKPTEIIGRNTFPVASEIFRGRLPDSQIWNVSTEQQFALQMHYFGSHAYIGLLNPPGIYKKVRRIAKWSLGRYTPHVLSTGAWAVLVALHRHPESAVVAAGIGATGGPHWNDAGSLQDTTAMKTRYLFSRLPEELRTRLVVTDARLAALARVEVWQGGIL